MTVQQVDGATTRLGGSLLASDAVRLVVDYEDGASDEIPFTWVSSPMTTPASTSMRSPPSTGPSGTALPSCARST